MLLPLAAGETRRVGFSFPLAPTVEPGDKITSTQAAGLAAAINARLRSGIADGAERVAYLTRNAFLQIINPEGDLWLPQSHFFIQRQMAEPEHAEWPAIDPGSPGGAAIGSIWPTYVYGAESLALDSEGVRLTDPIYGLTITPAGPTLRDKWELGKRQRGAWDPETGGLACPAFTAARSHSAIRWRWWSQQGAAFGGFLPTANVSSTPCEDPLLSDDYPAPPNLEVFFTSLADGSLRTYAGTCQDGPDLPTPGMYDSHVFAIGYSPWSYYVMLNDGTLDELSRAEWVEGPYLGAPYLRRTDANHFERFMHRFSGEFRGVEANETAMLTRSTAKWTEAADFGRILRQQYLLAPQVGHQAGDTIEPIYQSLLVPQSGAAGPISPPAGAKLAGFIADGAGLGGPVSIRAIGPDGETLATVSVSPDAPHATATLHPCPASVTWESSSAFSGEVTVEPLELLDYRPGPWDVFLIMRIGGART